MHFSRSHAIPALLLHSDLKSRLFHTSRERPFCFPSPGQAASLDHGMELTDRYLGKTVRIVVCPALSADPLRFLSLLLLSYLCLLLQLHFPSIQLLFVYFKFLQPLLKCQYFMIDMPASIKTASSFPFSKRNCSSYCEYQYAASVSYRDFVLFHIYPP